MSLTFNCELVCSTPPSHLSHTIFSSLDQISEDMRLQWKNGIPYFPIGRRHYTCHQGKDKNLAKKKKYLEKKQEKV